MGSITVKQSDIVKISITSYGPYWYECTLSFFAQSAAGGSVYEGTIHFGDEDLPYYFNLSNVYNDESDPVHVVENTDVDLEVECNL